MRKKETIGPARAQQYLDTMGPATYPVAPQTVLRYAKHMKSGAWVLIGPCLIVDEEGKMLSGRRRMMAVIEADLEVEFVVQVGTKEYPAYHGEELG